MLPVAIIGSAVSAITNLIDNLHTSDKEKLDAEIELRRIGLQEQIIEAQLIAGQQQTNAAEAQHRSLFVAGWRPAIGWIGAVSLGYQFVLYPLLIWAWAWMQAQGWIPRELTPPPVLSPVCTCGWRSRSDMCNRTFMDRGSCRSEHGAPACKLLNGYCHTVSILLACSETGRSFCYSQTLSAPEQTVFLLCYRYNRGTILCLS